MNHLRFLFFELLEISIGIDRVYKHIGMAKSQQVSQDLHCSQGIVQANCLVCNTCQVKNLAKIANGGGS